MEAAQQRLWEWATELQQVAKYTVAQSDDETVRQAAGQFVQEGAEFVALLCPANGAIDIPRWACKVELESMPCKACGKIGTCGEDAWETPTCVDYCN